MASYFGRLCAVRKLIKCGADVTIVSSSGYNCLDAAIMGGQKDICMEIMKHDKYESLNYNATFTLGHLL